VKFVIDFFAEQPGRWFLVAGLLPLVGVIVLMFVGVVMRTTWPHSKPTTFGGWFALLITLLAAGCAVQGLRLFLESDAMEPGLAGTIAVEQDYHERLEWLRLGPTKAERLGTMLTVGYRVDRLTAALVPMVAIVTALIVLFSIGYMKDEAERVVDDHAIHHRRRGRFGQFFLYLLLFEFSMIWLLLGDNLLQVFMGWELVGASSYFLIGFYTERKSAVNAANKAFLVNRVGDAGFLVGIFTAWAAFGTMDLDKLGGFLSFNAIPGRGEFWHTVLGLGIFCGCVGKSAQVPLHTWLRDAMEGPTPVSALIHAATMVAAGVYLVARCYPLFNETTFTVIAYTGAFTMLLAAVIAVRMTDIKRVLAYSTMSQLGFMMLALGVGGWSAGVFHLLTHAFFKALLFLGAGSVIHALHHEQDLRAMGGLRKRMPLTAYAMLAGVLAIAGFPLTSGWASKDQILGAALGFSLTQPTHVLLILAPLLTAALTAYYMGRLWLLAFAGNPRSAAAEHAHESPWAIVFPLIALAAFSIALGWGWPIWDPEAGPVSRYLDEAKLPSIVDFAAATKSAHEHHLIAGAAALLAAGLGAGTAIVRYRAGTLTVPAAGIVGKSLDAEAGIDGFYRRIFTRAAIRLGASTAGFDKQNATKTRARFDFATLDGWATAPADAVVAVAPAAGRIQTGNVRHYVLALVLTVAAGFALVSLFAL